MKLRIGVFGGMFDPVHRGHIEAANYAAAALALNSVKLVPCKNPNHRASAFSAAEHRVNMLKLAIAEYAQLSIDKLELEREGISYMVETLEVLKKSHSNTSLVLILGLDSFNTLPNWHRFDDIFKVASVYVLPRRRGSVSAHAFSRLQGSQRQCKSVAEFQSVDSGRFYIDTEFEFEASSTAVRGALDNPAELQTLLDSKVCQYIQENRLYR